MLTWRETKWRYKSLAISFTANAIVAASVPVFGFITVWLLIPGAAVVFWLCDLLDQGCKGRYEIWAWVSGWFVNTVFCWAVIWAAGFLRARKAR